MQTIFNSVDQRLFITPIQSPYCIFVFDKQKQQPCLYHVTYNLFGYLLPSIQDMSVNEILKGV